MEAEVVEVIRDGSDGPLVRAVGVLLARASVETDSVIWLVPLARDVSEALVHR